MVNHTPSDRGRDDDKEGSKVEKRSFAAARQLCKALTLDFRTRRTQRTRWYYSTRFVIIIEIFEGIHRAP